MNLKLTKIKKNKLVDYSQFSELIKNKNGKIIFKFGIRNVPRITASKKLVNNEIFERRFQFLILFKNFSNLFPQYKSLKNNLQDFSIKKQKIVSRNTPPEIKILKKAQNSHKSNYAKTSFYNKKELSKKDIKIEKRHKRLSRELIKEFEKIKNDLYINDKPKKFNLINSFENSDINNSNLVHNSFIQDEKFPFLSKFKQVKKNLIKITKNKVNQNYSSNKSNIINKKNSSLIQYVRNTGLNEDKFIEEYKKIDFSRAYFIYKRKYNFFEDDSLDYPSKHLSYKSRKEMPWLVGNNFNKLPLIQSKYSLAQRRIKHFKSRDDLQNIDILE